MNDLPPEVRSVIAGYERRIASIIAELVSVSNFKVTRSGRIIPRSAEATLARHAIALRRELKDLQRYVSKLEGRQFKPSSIYWLEKARMSLQPMQEESMESDSQGSAGEVDGRSDLC